MSNLPFSFRQRLTLFSAICLVAGMVPVGAAQAQTANGDLSPVRLVPDPDAAIRLAQATPQTAPGTTNATAVADSTAPAAAEQIVVTGSRVKRTNLEAISPVVTVTSADIQAKGLTNTADVINQLPQAGVATSSSVNSNFSTDAAGLQIVNLRNLGSDRTLVLIDGRRTVGGLPPGQGGPGSSSGVDISTIPAYLIDKVDVVTGGGSSAYGSEAVAGVVNFRLKESFNGVLFNQQLGATSGHGDSRTTTSDLLIGSDFADGRGHAIFAAEYQDQGEVLSKDRAFSALDINGGGVYSPSTFSLYSRTATDNGNFVGLGDGTIAPYTKAYGFNREALRTIQVPTTQLDTYSKIAYDVTPNFTLFSDFKFARTTATSLLEPIAIGAGQGSTTIGFGNDILQIPLTNPYIPAALSAQGIVDDGNGNIADFRRRFSELGDRGSELTRYNYAITTGAKGVLLDRFNWQTYYTFSQTTSTGVETNSGNVLNLQNALNAEVGPGGVIQCSDPSARAAGCIPINLFGPNTASAASLNYIRAIKTYNDSLSEGDFEADIAGPIYKLPYGDIQLSLGAEHRREDASSTPDALTSQGFGLDSSGPATRGGYAVTDFFAETKIPILKDLPFAKSLTFEAGYRHSEYTLGSVGGQDSYKYGGTYAPIPDILFRIENAVAIRAPTVSDLYTGRTQSAVSVNDPCSSAGLDSAVNRSARIANCAKIPGITPGFTEDQAAQQTEISYNSGNPNLTAERARVFSYGVVLQPRYIPRFSATIDAFKYFIADAVGTIPIQTAADQCADTLQEAFCSLVRRDPVTGQIQGVDAKAINVGAIREQGVDVQLSYELRVPGLAHYMFRNVDDIGAIDFGWNYQYLQYLNQITIPGNVTEETGDFGAPKNKWIFNALYRDDKFQLNYQMRYVGEQRYSFYGDGPLFRNRFYSDLSLRYQVTPKVSVYSGVRNLFDRQPPQLDQSFQQTGAGVASGVTGTNTVPDVYDAIGRYVYAGFKVQF